MCRVAMASRYAHSTVHTSGGGGWLGRWHFAFLQETLEEQKIAQSTESANSKVHAGCIKGAERLTGVVKG